LEEERREQKEEGRKGGENNGNVGVPLSQIGLIVDPS